MTVHAPRIFARPGISHIRLVALLLTVFAIAAAGQQEPSKPPAKQWPAATPASVGLDAAALAALDADLASGQYGLVDSTLVIRCGKLAFEHAYPRDYGKIYGERAKKTGPLNHDLHGPYNYFSTEFHPYYRHSDLHTMQSVSKYLDSAKESARSYLPRAYVLNSR